MKGFIRPGARLRVEQIARKIGMPDNIQRVIEGLERKGVKVDIKRDEGASPS